MNDTAWHRVADILADALGVPLAERAALLDTSCRSADGTVDRALRREVEAFLAASDAADADGSLASPVAGLVDDAALVDDVPLGTAIGPWRLTGVLGEGGMGIVYRAERADGAFEREVALKRLRSGPGRRRLAARLRAERQTLARLEHPGVARLYDGGVSDDGTPYLVMEWVDGEPVTAWAQRTGASVEARVRLFVQVCEAVAYAHARLVVHRDLKPSNVFVVDGDPPRVKLLDFGIAKLLDATDATQTASAAMTPAYAAPEQLTGGDITTATDVYSLGVVLYELLTGQRPYDVSGVTAGEAERIVRESLPSRPSSVAGDRRLAGDLDTVVMKALAKEPARRYASAEALGDDLRRHLDGLPVDARPATIRYRVGRFVRRHKGAAAAAAFAVLALVGGLGAALWQAREAARERDRAEVALTQAEGTLDYLERTILLGDLQQNEEDPPISAVLDSAAARVDDEADPAVARAIHQSLANVYLSRGDPGRAAHHAERAANRLGDDRGLDYVAAQSAWAQALADNGEYEAALPHHEAALSALDAFPDADVERGIASNVYAVTLDALGRSGEAEALYRQAVDAARRAEEPFNEATALNNLATLLITSERTEEAIQVYRDLIAAHAQSDDASASYGLGFSQVNLANALSNFGAAEEALTTYREAVATFGSRLGPEHPETLGARVSLAFHLHRMGRFGEAARGATATLRDAERVLSEDHPYIAYAQNVAGFSLCDGGDPARGAALQRTSLATRRQSFPPDHWILANGESLLGDCLARLGQRDQAGRLLTRSVATLADALGDDHQRTRDARARLAAFERGR
ncbi:protein kinase domain-containing protein [Rubrivirga sp. IMCC43871]|uniref:serine/threonine-protein kinase n=1 Tax=Rubrivirga sp. IMCC43871 TaxID=3391575 RepID=UPI00398FF71F